MSEQQPTLVHRAGWFVSGVAGGTMLGATIAGGIGASVGAAAGAFAGVVRAVTGVPILEQLSQDAADTGRQREGWLPAG